MQNVIVWILFKKNKNSRVVAQKNMDFHKENRRYSVCYIQLCYMATRINTISRNCNDFVFNHWIRKHRELLGSSIRILTFYSSKT